MPPSKRTFDLLLVAVMAPFALLAGGAIAIAIAIDGPGSILYRSVRVGFGGLDFEMLKFRSMRIDNAGHAISGEGDPRITRVGAFLRRTRFDELPQLWNIAKGQMSFVGPRPELRIFIDLYPEDYDVILSVLPGITGPTQLRYAPIEAVALSQASDPERYYVENLLPGKVEMDREYARNRSLFGDLTIMARTLTQALPRSAKRRRPQR